MSTELNRINTRKTARSDLRKLVSKSENVFVIHYSCESFFETIDGKSPRITSIAIRNLETAQSRSFSIHQYAEIKKIDNDSIEDQYEQIEKIMLDDYFEFIRNH